MHSTLGLVLHLHSQVTEPEFVRFCVLDPELGDSVVRIFRAVIRENNFDSLLAKMTIPLARNSATQHLFKNLHSLWIIEVMLSFVSESWSFLFERWTSGIFFQQTKPPKVKWIYLMPLIISWVGELTKIEMSKDGMFWQGCRTPLMLHPQVTKCSWRAPSGTNWVRQRLRLPPTIHQRRKRRYRNIMSIWFLVQHV